MNFGILRAAAVLLVWAAGTARAQAPAAEEPEVDSAPRLETTDPEWELSFEALQYLIDDEKDYLQTTLAADREELHLELRWNYEDYDTASIWIGWNFSAGDENIVLEFTPMLGFSSGEATGALAGYIASLDLWNFNVYNEAEYYIDTGDTDADWFYMWSEASFAPIEWFRFGVVAESYWDEDVEWEHDPGVLAAVTIGIAEIAVYVFNPDDDDPTLAFGVALEF